MAEIYIHQYQISQYTEKEASILELRFLIVYHLALKIYPIKKNDLDLH